MILVPLKPSARWCFVAAKLDFGSCLLGSTATFRQGSESNVGAFQVDGWTWDIASFAVLSRIFRGSFAKFGCQKWQVQILNLNWALATVFNALYNPSCDTWLPQLRPYLLCQLPVHSHWSIPNEQNKLKYLELLFRDLSRSKSLSRKWCSTTPLHEQYIEVFFVAHMPMVCCIQLVPSRWWSRMSHSTATFTFAIPWATDLESTN